MGERERERGRGRDRQTERQTEKETEKDTEGSKPNMYSRAKKGRTHSVARGIIHMYKNHNPTPTMEANQTLNLIKSRVPRPTEKNMKTLH